MYTKTILTNYCNLIRKEYPDLADGLQEKIELVPFRTTEDGRFICTAGDVETALRGKLDELLPDLFKMTAVNRDVVSSDSSDLALPLDPVALLCADIGKKLLKCITEGDIFGLTPVTAEYTVERS